MKASSTQVRVEVLRKLECYQPTVSLSPSPEAWRRSPRDGQPFWAERIPSHFRDNCYHYPVVLDPDGNPWQEANRYLLSRLADISPISHRTLESIAGDLAHFRQWQLDDDIDFLTVPGRPRARLGRPIATVLTCMTSWAFKQSKPALPNAA